MNLSGPGLFALSASYTPGVDKQRASRPTFRSGDRVADAASNYSPRSHHADPVDFRGKRKGDAATVGKTGTDPSAGQRLQLELLLGPADGSRLSLLESLKRGPVTISGPAFNEAIERWKTLTDFGLHADNLSALPTVRLKISPATPVWPRCSILAGCHHRKR